MKLKVGTFNILHGKDYRAYLADKTDRIDLSLTAGIIRELGLDVCGLNEVRNQEKVEGLVNQAKEIAGLLGYEYVFAKAIDYRGGEYGNALVSRYPITNVRTYPVETTPDEREAGKFYENRVLLCADLNINGKTLTVWVTHFGLRKIEQEKEIELIRKLSENKRSPMILMGDFNFTPDSECYGELAAMFRDTSDIITGNTLTFPSEAPRAKIDYLFTDENCRVLSAMVPDAVVSDHRPYVAEIEI